MFHVLFLVKRNPSMTPNEFATYWIDEHTPLTASVPGVLSYRCYTAAGQQEDPSGVDGVAVLSFADESAYRAAVAGPEFAAAVADAPMFQDTGATTSFFAEEHIIV